MANFVTNIVHFDGDPERILDLRGAVQDDQYGMSGIDFNKIVPMPSGLWMGGINPDTRARYGKNNWLDWSVANWGTKWNAFRFDDDDQYSDSQITFVTANNAPAPIMQKLSEMYPDITMRHQWADDIIAMNLITEHNAQLRCMMDLANTIGSNLLLISTESFYHDAISLVFKESFQDTDKLLDWWLYESYDQELYLGEQKFDASDPGNFYDFLVKYRQDWKEQRQCNAPPQKPVQISKDCFRKAIALVRKEQNSLQTVADAARECSSIFNVHGNTSKYLDALILLLQDLFDDAKGLIRWYITKPVDHKVFIGDTMYDLNDPGALYDFMLTHAAELKGAAV